MSMMTDGTIHLAEMGFVRVDLLFRVTAHLRKTAMALDAAPVDTIFTVIHLDVLRRAVTGRTSDLYRLMGVRQHRCSRLLPHCGRRSVCMNNSEEAENEDCDEERSIPDEFHSSTLSSKINTSVLTAYNSADKHGTTACHSEK